MRGKCSHVACTRFSISHYDTLTTIGEFSWQWPSCLFAVLPSSDISELSRCECCDEPSGCSGGQVDTAHSNIPIIITDLLSDPLLESDLFIIIFRD